MDYIQLENKSVEIADQVIALLETMTPDKTESFFVKDFLSAVNTAGGRIKAAGCNIDKTEVKNKLNAALDDVCKAMYCLEMFNKLVAVDISCYERLYRSYDELADMLALGINEMAD